MGEKNKQLQSSFECMLLNYIHEQARKIKIRQERDQWFPELRELKFNQQPCL